MALPATPCLALVTDRSLCPGPALAAAVAAAVAGGVGLVQLRERDLPSGQLLALALRLKEAIAGRALFLVNDRVDVAMASGADGVQLGEGSLPVAAARSLVGPSRLVGRSVHTVEGAVRAEAEGADLLVAGTVFPSRSHPGGEAGGVAPLAEICRRVRVPVLGIGGITAANVDQVVDAGAGGAAVITAILGHPDPQAAARRLAEAMRLAWMGRRPAGGGV